MNNQITPGWPVGYVVVRSPKAAYDPYFSSTPLGQPARIGETFYHGLDRMPWFDLEELFHAKSLNKEAIALWSRLQLANKHLYGVNFCPDYELAIRLLKHSIEQTGLNEIIMIQSPKLSEVFAYSNTELPRTLWLGYDVMAVGEWSLLREGVYLHKELERLHAGALNQWGLLETEGDAYRLIESYAKLSDSGVVEPLGTLVQYDIVSIFRILC